MNELTPAEEQRLRFAMHALAAHSGPAQAVAVGRRRRSRGAVRSAGIAAGIAAAAVTASLVVLGGGDGARTPRTAVPPARTTTQPTTAQPTTDGSAAQPTTDGSAARISYDLRRLSAESALIVVGTVTEVRHGSGEAAGGLPYVLAHIRVDRALRGADSSVWAFDYDLGSKGGVVSSESAVSPESAVSSELAGPPWRVGESVLLFLASSAGTVHAEVEPGHLQVVGGAQGRYAVHGERLDAPFTFAQLRLIVKSTFG